MAISTCIKCGGHTFEVEVVEPLHSAFKLLFIQCSNCGSVIGVMDYQNIGAALEQIRAKLNEIQLQTL